MNLPNIPFELILVVLFFVLPALGSLQKRLRERRGRDGETDASSDRERRQASAEPTRTETGTLSRAPKASTQASTQTSTQPRADSGGPRWLEEAQRRVREAQQAEADARGRRSVNPRTLPQTPVVRPGPRPAARPSSPTRTPQPDARPQNPVQTRTPATSLEGPALEGHNLETYRPERTSLEDANANLTTAPPLRVQRLGAGKRATISPYELRFDASTLMNGVVWHQVLSPPLSKRRTRLSQRRP